MENFELQVVVAHILCSTIIITHILYMRHDRTYFSELVVISDHNVECTHFCISTVLEQWKSGSVDMYISSGIILLADKPLEV